MIVSSTRIKLKKGRKERLEDERQRKRNDSERYGNKKNGRK